MGNNEIELEVIEEGEFSPDSDREYNPSIQPEIAAYQQTLKLRTERTNPITYTIKEV